MPARIIMRALAGLAVTAGVIALALAGAAPASAHVTIRADVTATGSFAKITVRVPNESENAATTRLELEFPENTFGSVSVQPHPGWTADVNTAELDEPVDVGNVTLDEVVTAVTWTADNTGIRPGEFDEFAISVGPLPEPGEYLFPAHQEYSDGEVVSWDMPPADEEPENPAPSITVVEAEAAEQTASDATAGDAAEGGAGNEAAAATDTDNSDELARGIAIGGVVIGGAGVGVGAMALRRSHA